MQDLTTGPVTRHLLKTTSFMLVMMVFQTLYFLVDLYWVGRLGKEAVAAVGLSGNLMFIVLAVSQMLGVGTTTLVSHAAGQRDRERALLVFNQAQVLSMLVAVLFFVVAMALRPLYALGLAADAETARLAGQYLLWFVPASALQFGLVAMGAALRGTGQFKPGMLVQSATVVLNMVLAPILVFGWGTGRPLGVAGAALATLISVAVGTVWLLTFFRAGQFLVFLPRDWKPNFRMWGRLLSIGLPAGVEFGLMAAYLFVVYAVSKPFGSESQAGFGIGMRVVQAGFMPVVALGFSVAPVAGQNFGARLAGRVRDTYTSAVGIAVCTMLALTLVAQLFAPTMVGVFSPDPRVVAVGAQYLRIICWSFVFSGVLFVNSSMFQAMGNTLPSLATSGIRLVAVSLPAVLLSRLPGFELRWIWWLSVASVTLQLALSLWLLQREFRKRLAFAPVPAAEPVLEAAAP